ncbi:MAG: hypothetical protein C4K48_02965 [Candidatus Thorarchaeota archaeon]|nr:MAG: hypothetical protein C4K48_02965 [Candidatus Thorarchaeota archaeon]
MSRMAVRSFPRTHNKPPKWILLVPFILMVGGWAMTFVYFLQFLGSIIALTGALTIFLVGAVYADLWASYRRTQQLIKGRQEEGRVTSAAADIPPAEDPFEETFGEE